MMRIVTEIEQKEMQINILKYVHDMCVKNGIEYSLCGGTLLGAVRHKGFIPWDDDIDIFLTRPEYEKLIALLENGKYLLISPKEDKYYHVFSKLVDSRTRIEMTNKSEEPIPNLGIFIDIFPIDGLPDKKEDQEKFTKKTRSLMYQMRLTLSREYHNATAEWKKKVKKIFLYPVHILAKLIRSPEKRKKDLLNKMISFPFEKSTHGGFILSAYGIKEALLVDVFKGQKELEFEGDKFMAFERYEEYLVAIYGDYMKLPPEEKRVSHHDYVAYWKE